MRALVITCHDPFRPANHRQSRVVRRGRKISSLAPRTHRPFICILNGKPFLRAGWRRRVDDGDVIGFVVLPMGGGGDGGKNPLKVVLQIAVAVFAPQIATGLLGQSLAATSVLGTTLGKIVGGVIGLAGSMLVSALLPPPRPTAAQIYSSSGGLAAPSPTYSIGAQGNAARIGQPIPSFYGQHIIYPDFGAMPYLEYSGNEQFLYQLLVIGQGDYSVDAVRIDDTDISNFEEITYQVIPPGGTVTLFPTSVTTSAEVDGQEALTGVTLGPFVANASGTLANTIAIDVVMPRGLYYANDSGGLTAMSCSWSVEARAIDDVGVPVGGWVAIGAESYAAATTTTQRASYRYSVASGRYEVRLTRTDTKQTDARYGHDLFWSGLRAYLPGSQQYGSITVLAMRLRATNNLSQIASRKINVIATRKLSTWSSVTGWSATTVATRSPAWAFVDVCRAAYGAGLPDARIDLVGIEALASSWAARGDTFDGGFDSQGTVWEALTQIARAGRAMPFVQGGIVHCMRDAAAIMPVAMFTQRNIIKGSMRLQYLLPSEETADSVEVTYFDSANWTERTVNCVLPSSTSARPAKIKLFGVTSRAQAWREGMFIAACNRYRRRIVTFSTEMEGFVPAPGDCVAVQHDMPKWGQSGEIVAWDAGTKTATLSEPLDWSAGGAHVLSFRTRSGAPSGPYATTIGESARHVMLSDWDALTDPTPDTGASRERSHFAFGPANAQYIRCRVLGISPSGTETVDIAAVVESDFVHTADTGAAPGDTAWQLPSRFTAPVVLGLTAYSMPSAPDKMVLGWQPAPGADHYLIEQSNGDGRWTRCGEVASSNFSTIAIYGAATIVRVAAVGITRGPWVEVAYGASASYMWAADSNTLMWAADSNTLMWEY